MVLHSVFHGLYSIFKRKATNSITSGNILDERARLQGPQPFVLMRIVKNFTYSLLIWVSCVAMENA